MGGYPLDGRPDRPPAWWRAAGIVLMLPIGIIVVVILFFLFGGDFGYFRGEFLLILLAVLLLVFVARLAFRSSRRRYWREQRAQHAPVRILRERYARGEITNEQYEEMMKELHQRRS